MKSKKTSIPTFSMRDITNAFREIEFGMHDRYGYDLCPSDLKPWEVEEELKKQLKKLAKKRSK